MATDLTMSTEALRDAMRSFVRGEDRSLALAGAIEVALECHFGDRQPYADLWSALASYRPGGGEFLYGADEIVPIVNRALQELEKDLEGDGA